MTRIVLATRSHHKLLEIQAILAVARDVRVVDLESAGLAYDPAEEDLEPYDTFEANARSKALHFFHRSGVPTAADDSGLEVDALDGAPGVRTKRFAPAAHLEGDALDRANLDHLIERLRGVEPSMRSARYVCVAVLATREGTWTFRGEAPGLILDGRRGSGGFGYDPVFFDPGLGKTFAEITQAEKNARSHRGKAFRALAEHLARG